MSTIPKGTRKEIQTIENSMSSADKITELFKWNKSECTAANQKLLKQKTDQTHSLSVDDLNQIFQKRNGKKYGIGWQLGSGGFGNVYSINVDSINDDDKPKLCVKVIDLFLECRNHDNVPYDMTNNELLTYDSFQTRLKFAEREFRINTKIFENKVENCVGFHPELSFVDHSIRPYLTFLVMDRMDGNISERPKDLNSNVTNRSLALKMMNDILRALDTINMFDITSRDITPSNIMYRNEDESNIHFYLGDFGIGTIDSKNYTTTDTESAFKDKCTPSTDRDIRSDIYSLALVAAYVDQGYPKDENGKPSDMHQDLDLRRINPAENDTFYQILLKATDSKREHRYSGPDEVRTAIILSQTSIERNEKTELSLYKKIDILNESHKNEIRKLRNDYEEQIEESEQLIDDLNQKNAEQLNLISQLKSEKTSDAEEISGLRNELNEKKSTISTLMSGYKALQKENSDLEEANEKYAEIAAAAPDKLWLSSKILLLITVILFITGILFDLILSFEIVSMIHYLLTTVFSCVYIWMLYAKRIRITQSIRYQTTYGDTLLAEPVTKSRLTFIRSLTIISILLILPALNIIRYFSEIRAKSSEVHFALFENQLKVSFSSSCICLFLSICFMLGLILFNTFYFAYSKKRSYDVKENTICFLLITVFLILLQTGMYFLAGYNTLGFRLKTDKPVIYWHDPSSTLSRASRISNAAAAIRYENIGVTDISYDEASNTIIFSNSLIAKPLYFEGDTNIRIDGTCTFDNKTKFETPNITVYNGNLSIFKNPDAQLNLYNDHGTNLRSDGYLYISPDKDFTVNANCNSEDGCIYSQWITETNSYSLNVSNKGDGSSVVSGLIVKSSQAQKFTIVKSETGATETYNLNEIQNASSAVTGARYDEESKTVILNNAVITAPISFDGNIQLSIYGKCSFTNPNNYQDALLKSKNGSINLIFNENGYLEMTNHTGADIISDHYVHSTVYYGDTKPKFTCNTSGACIFANYSTNINHNIAEIENENPAGTVLPYGLE